ncbi:DNase I-like protein [Lojkania enalia]|uniref:DNA-(apurinic or apyrimidinic site) endonuclease 2 n=1 Tax=Lojkania enalia TaxID=147567 RepID=A0A9P4KCS6_9PLEO|nr:DNase I-like protein [Didymosphaeria enalia]
MVRITSWNVNGIRNPFGYQPWRESRSFNAMFDILEADVVIMQELKIQRKDLQDDMVLVPGWDCYFSLPKHKKGYSGVGIYTRQAVCTPIRAEEGLLGVLTPPGSSTPYRDLPEDTCIGGYPTSFQVAELGVDPAVLDAEGRCVVLEFPAFVLFGVYSPANSNGLRDDFRYGFICALDTRIRNLEKMGKRVIVTGDLNVSREEIDTARAEENMRELGITRDEYLNSPNRRIFNQLLENGKVPGGRDEGRKKPILYDLCREFHPMRRGMFTHWEQKINARPGNFGSRIDFVLCSIEMKSWFSDANIQEGLMGSDHCPVFATMKNVVDLQGQQRYIVDLLNPPGMFKDGKRLRNLDPAQDLLPLSGKLLPEFDKRRSIKDMLIKKPSVLGAKATTSSQPESSNTIAASEVDRQQILTMEQSDLPSGPSTQPTALTPMKAPEKRRQIGSPVGKSVKRSKSRVGSSDASSLPKGQQSLKSFFVPKSSAVEASGRIPSLLTEQDDFGVSYCKTLFVLINGQASQQNPQSRSNLAPDTESFKLSNTAGTTLSLLPTFSSSLIDPQASKESWTRLFSKKPPPLCESHHEPCISLTTKKTGPNCGRQFWICPRPLGPLGQREKGTQWRCSTFIWASDWNAPGGQLN